MTSDKETEQKISQLQLLEQGIQNFNLQKQQFQSKLMETDSALEELNSTDTCYKIIGNIMVKSDKTSLKEQLEEDKTNINIRIKAVEKQEEAIRQKAKAIQEEVIKEMKQKENK